MKAGGGGGAGGEELALVCVRAWSSRPLGLVEIPGLRGRMPWQVSDSLLNSTRGFLSPVAGGQTSGWSDRG